MQIRGTVHCEIAWSSVVSFCNLFQRECTLRGRRNHKKFYFKNVIAYKLVCFLLFSTCLIHSSCSSVHGKASWDSFTSVFCHVEFLWCRFHVVRFVHRVDTYVGLVVCSSKPYVNKLILRKNLTVTFDFFNFWHCYTFVLCVGLQVCYKRVNWPLAASKPSWQACILMSESYKLLFRSKRNSSFVIAHFKCFFF